MIKGAKVLIADNSGVKIVAIINIERGRKYARIGDIVTASVKKVKRTTGTSVKKGSIVKVLIIGARAKYNGLRYSSNIGLVLKNDKELLGTRLIYPVPFSLLNIPEIAEIKKIFSLAPLVV